MTSRREECRKNLHPAYIPFYDALCLALPEMWQPYFGWRSIDDQNELYKVGRTRSGHKVTRARGGESPHNYGCASDWTVWEGGKALWPDVSDHVWEVYKEALQRVGLKWGGDFKIWSPELNEKIRNPDAPHNELKIKYSWKVVHGVYLSKGLVAAVDFIQSNQGDKIE